MSINGTSGLVFNDASTQNTAATGFGFKNRIINGVMMIDQRNAGASVTPTNGQYTLDRWAAWGSQSSKYTIQQNAGSVTPSVGFINYMGATSSSAYSIVSNDYFMLQQNIEGLNVSDLNWGSANAQPVTLSFWVRSSLTGTFGGSLRNSASNRSYVFSYTISAANTWEQKTITIAGDTTGTWLTTNGIGIQLVFAIGAGSTFSGTAGSWQAGNFVSSTGATSVVGTSGATFYITGVQLEKGSTATSFDYRPYGTELSLCQRYYGVCNYLSPAAPANGTTSGFGQTISYKVNMRAAPTATYTTGQDGGGTAGSLLFFTASGSGVNVTPNTANLYVDGARFGNSTGTYTYLQGTVFLSAEL
jgi:hypothetical protein